MAEKQRSEFDLLSVKEAALALRCSPQTVYRAVHDGSIPWFRVRPRGQIKIPYYGLEGLIAPHLIGAAEQATAAMSEQVQA